VDKKKVVNQRDDHQLPKRFSKTKSSMKNPGTLSGIQKESDGKKGSPATWKGWKIPPRTPGP
jgi:hypothetical protein